MANVTTIYACTEDGLAIFNKPGTLNEWLPPRLVLGGMPVLSVWAEAGPPVRVVALQDCNLLVSENGGRAWEKIDTEHPAVALFPGETERKIYAALGGGLLSSDDAGSSWRKLASVPSDTRGIIMVGGVFYLTAGMRPEWESGALYSGEPEKGTWRILINGGIRAVSYNEGAGRLYASTADGITESADAGETWTTLPGSPTDGVELLAVPGAAGKPPALVVGTSGGISVSPDGGESWQQKDVGGRVTALARDPERRDRLYAGTHEGYIFESGNRGQAWTPVNAAPLPHVISLFLVRI
ncbi:MAG: hypothetical protein ABIO92_10565 [Chloroflexia bacterium]